MKTKIFIEQIILILLLAAASLSAENTKSPGKYDVPDRMVKNLEAGLQSSNYGLKSSCIYLAGLYEIEEMADALIELLNSNCEAELKTLTVLSLYKIGTEKCLYAIGRLANSEKDGNLKRIGVAVLNHVEADNK